jgi:hypothetical protein
MWPKLLSANATEAISRKDSTSNEVPTVEAVKAFLDAAERGQSSEKPLVGGVRLETRDADKALYFETKRAGGAWIHRNYLAKWHAFSRLARRSLAFHPAHPRHHQFVMRRLKASATFLAT